MSCDMHAHAQFLDLFFFSCPNLKPRNLERLDSGLFHNWVHYRAEQQNRNQRSCQWTWVPDAYCTRWQVGDDALGLQRRTHHSFLMNFEMADMVHIPFLWAPVGPAVLKPVNRIRSLGLLGKTIMMGNKLLCHLECRARFHFSGTY